MAARNLAALQTAVQAYGLPADAGSALVQQGWLNDEYRELAGRRRWKWLEATTTVVTAAGTASYTPAATDIRSLDAIRLADSAGNEVLIDWRPTQWVRDMVHRYNQLSDRNQPQYWTQFAGQIYFYPIPDGVYTAVIDYTKNITPLNLSTDTPLVPEAFDDILVLGAAARGMIRSNNWLQRDSLFGLRDQLINRMESEIGKDQTQRSDEVESTGIWDTRAGWRWP